VKDYRFYEHNNLVVERYDDPVAQEEEYVKEQLEFL
jgi:hypothetical protein